MAPTAARPDDDDVAQAVLADEHHTRGPQADFGSSHDEALLDVDAGRMMMSEGEEPLLLTSLQRPLRCRAWRTLAVVVAATLAIGLALSVVGRRHALTQLDDGHVSSEAASADQSCEDDDKCLVEKWKSWSWKRGCSSSFMLCAGEYAHDMETCCPKTCLSVNPSSENRRMAKCKKDKEASIATTLLLTPEPTPSWAPVVPATASPTTAPATTTFPAILPSLDSLIIRPTPPPTPLPPLQDLIDEAEGINSPGRAGASSVTVPSWAPPAPAPPPPPTPFPTWIPPTPRPTPRFFEQALFPSPRPTPRPTPETVMVHGYKMNGPTVEMATCTDPNYIHPSPHSKYYCFTFEDYADRGIGASPCGSYCSTQKNPKGNWCGPAMQCDSTGATPAPTPYPTQFITPMPTFPPTRPFHMSEFLKPTEAPVKLPPPPICLDHAFPHPAPHKPYCFIFSGYANKDVNKAPCGSYCTTQAGTGADLGCGPPRMCSKSTKFTQKFKQVEPTGCCRTASGDRARTETQWKSPLECKAACEGLETCTAYQMLGFDQCEIQKGDLVTQTSIQNMDKEPKYCKDVECWAKLSAAKSSPTKSSK